MRRATAMSAAPSPSRAYGGGSGACTVAAALSGAVTSIGILERSHPAGHDTRTVSTNSAPTATSATSSTVMTVACAAGPAVMRAVRSRHSEARSCGALGGVTARHPAEHQAARETVLGEPALGLTSAIETPDDLAVDVDHLRVGGGSQSRQRIVQDRRRPRREERRGLDLVHRCRLLEILVDASGDEAVVSVHGLQEHCA